VERNGSDKHELLARLGEAAESLATSEGWQRWLAVAARFRTYSWHNTMLIFVQRPDATRVAGYRTWQSLGRQVRRGERGIGILAPLVRRVVDSETGERRTRIVGFRVVHVFDLTQTEGEALPVPTMPAVSLDDEGLYDTLVTAARAQGITVADAPARTDGVRGWWDPITRTIALVEGHPVASRTRTLLHELAHSIDIPTPEAAAGVDRATRELIAESVAFVVGSGLGLDLSDASAHYTVAWGGDRDRLSALGERVLSVAGELEVQLGITAVSPVAD
jgi:antirestriction protein ArdC